MLLFLIKPRMTRSRAHELTGAGAGVVRCRAGPSCWAPPPKHKDKAAFIQALFVSAWTASVCVSTLPPVEAAAERDAENKHKTWFINTNKHKALANTNDNYTNFRNLKTISLHKNRM